MSVYCKVHFRCGVFLASWPFHVAAVFESAWVRDSLFSGSGSQSDLTARAPHREPLVHVQDFLNLFPDEPQLPSLHAMDLSMQSMYGKILMPGDGTGFITNRATAPDRFQIRENAAWNYNMGNTSRNAQETRLEFDEFCMERVMLEKWMKKSITCGDDATCKRSADVIVVPSVMFHTMLRDGFDWATIETYAGDVSLHLRYFELLLELYPVGRAKHFVFVIHSSFVNGSPKGLYDSMFNALAMLPSSVQRHFVIASIESNLGKHLNGIFGPTWSASAHVQSQARQHGADDGGPLVVTLPYPVPVVAPVKWTHDHPPYMMSWRRPISVLFLGVESKGAGISGDHNAVRPLVWDALQQHGIVRPYKADLHAGPMANVNYGVFCLDPGKPNGTACGAGADVSFWELTANSDFCLQPPGDTLTRSHFYVSVVSGCIPIIFDGGHKDFDSEEPTWWAWRSPQVEKPVKLAQGSLWDALPLWEATESGNPFFDYKDFAIVVPAAHVNNSANMTRFLQWVSTIPEDDPERFLSMRRNLDRIAPFMLYRGGVGPETPDAFVAFENLVGKQVDIPWSRRHADSVVF